MTLSRLSSQALRSIRRYRLRTTFMALGSFLGVAALTFMVSLGRGVETKLLKMVGQLFGDASVLVMGGGSRIMGGAHVGGARLTLDDMNAVAKEVTGIDVWDPQAEISTSVRYGAAAATVRVIGESERWEKAWARGVSSGASFDLSAVSGLSRVAIIGPTAVRRLFGGENPIGADIQIGSVPFRVIGVLESLGTDLHGMDRDNEIVVPISTLMRRVLNADVISTGKLLVTDPSRQGEIAKQVRGILRTRHALDRDQPDDFRVITASGVQRNMAVVQRVLTLYVPLAGAIVLLVGGIVAATLMLASVSERVAEIGLRRAVGARPADIRAQFLLETMATVVAGGAFGVLLGYAGVVLVGVHMQLGTDVSWAAVIVSLAASAVVGLAAGVLPARRAAQLNPVDALR